MGAWHAAARLLLPVALDGRCAAIPAQTHLHTCTDSPGRNLGCANTACNLCKLSQRRRCQTNFSSKYLAPCDVVEAKCGAQVGNTLPVPRLAVLLSLWRSAAAQAGQER